MKGETKITIQGHLDKKWKTGLKGWKSAMMETIRFYRKYKR